MAQHIDARKIQDKSVKRILMSIQNTKHFRTSFKYFDVPYEDVKETLTDEVFACHCKVPESVVFGGRGYFEIHTEPRPGGGREASNIYLVA